MYVSIQFNNKTYGLQWLDHVHHRSILSLVNSVLHCSPTTGLCMNLLSNCREVSYCAYYYNNTLRLQPSETWFHAIHRSQKSKSHGGWFSATWQGRLCVKRLYGQNGWTCRLSLLCYEVFSISGSFNDVVSISVSNSSWPNLKYIPAFVWRAWGNPQKLQSSWSVSLSNLKTVPPEYQAGMLANATLSSNAMM